MTIKLKFFGFISLSHTCSASFVVVNVVKFIIISNHTTKKVQKVSTKENFWFCALIEEEIQSFKIEKKKNNYVS